MPIFSFASSSSPARHEFQLITLPVFQVHGAFLEAWGVFCQVLGMLFRVMYAGCEVSLSSSS